MKSTILVIITFIVLCLAIAFLIKDIKSLLKKVSDNIELIKAYDSENSGLKYDKRVFKLTIDQLNYYKDSITIKMKEAAKELKIKDSKIQSLLYQLTQILRVDTIIFKDTIFVKDLHVDTLILDEWYRLKLSLDYPNKIVVDPRFISEKYVIVHSKRETINPPKRFFLFRWFLKKLTVATVDILERSPYSKTKQERFILIIK